MQWAVDSTSVDRAIQERDRIMSALGEYMKNRVGPAKAVTGRDLASRFRVTTRVVRLAIRQLLRNQVLPIVSYEGDEVGVNVRGYFVPESDADFELYIEKLREKVQAITARIEDAQIAYEAWRKR